MAAKPSKAGPMELEMRVAISSFTGTPATCAIAWISLVVGLVMRFPLPARGYGQIPEWPYSTRLQRPYYRAPMERQAPPPYRVGKAKRAHQLPRFGRRGHGATRFCSPYRSSLLRQQ